MPSPTPPPDKPDYNEVTCAARGHEAPPERRACSLRENLYNDLRPWCKCCERCQRRCELDV